MTAEVKDSAGTLVTAWRHETTTGGFLKKLREADRKLAAFDDLLAALKGFVGACSRDNHGGRGAMFCDSYCLSAQIAIRQAEGGQ